MFMNAPFFFKTIVFSYLVEYLDIIFLTMYIKVCGKIAVSESVLLVITEILVDYLKPLLQY